MSWPKNAAVNIEADSINTALLAPDAAPGSAAFDAFVREVVREMTVKAGQKCTAIRRIFVPAARADATTDALAARLAAILVGDPRREDVRMGPVVTRTQQAAAFDGIKRLAGEAAIVMRRRAGAGYRRDRGGKSAFVAATLLRTKNGDDARAVHEVEVFGPAATVVPYRDEQDASALIARGGGSLVASLYGEDPAFLARMVTAIAPGHGLRAGGRCRPSPPPIPATASSCRNAITAVRAAPATARSSAGCTGCGSIISGSPCKARAICCEICRRRPPACMRRFNLSRSKVL